jgi:predicted signal transduction protein with EAL and GGDEF domain
MIQGLSKDLAAAAVQARVVGNKILDALNGRYLLARRELRSTCSIGIAMFGENPGSPEELLKRADMALYGAKAAGRRVLRFFDPQMQAAATARALVEADLRRGLIEGQFVLYYQPQVDSQGNVTGAEALSRWRHPNRGLLEPVEFVLTCPVFLNQS